MSLDPNIKVDTDALTPAEAAYTAAADRVTRIYGLANATNDEYTGCWGDDATGRMFGAAYGPAADKVLIGIKSVGGSLTDTVDGIVTMIKGYTDTENDNISAVHGLPNVPDDVTRG